MIDLITIIVLLTVVFFFIIASLEDIKKREVYDYINFLFTFLILVTGIFVSILNNSMETISYVGFGLLLGFFFGSVLYYIGIWGGGDAKFLIGFGAATYFLLNFKPYFNVIDINYELLANQITYYLNLGFTPFLQIILILNFIFIGFLLVRMFFSRDWDERRSQFNLFLILILLLIGLYFDYSEFVLFLLGFFAFVLIFFGKEDLFNCVYFRYKKKLSNLVDGDMIDDDIVIGGKKIVKFDDVSMTGLNKEQVNKIVVRVNGKGNGNKGDKLVFVRRIFPYAILVTLNYVGYIYKIVKVDEMNLAIVGYLIKFLFLSFIAGGVLVFVIILWYYVRNFRKIKIKLVKYEWFGFGFVFLFSLFMVVFYGINLRIFLLFNSLILAYLFIKVAKEVEGKLYVSKKDLDKIVPGDWIVQNIKSKGKVLYSQDDFKLGISEEQIKNIKRYAKDDINLKMILVKDGIAFLPPLFVGFLLMFLI